MLNASAFQIGFSIPHKRFLRWVVCLCGLLAPLNAFAQVAPPLQPIFWQQPILFIPYQLNKDDPATREIAQVQLLLSRTGANDWTVLQSAEPNVQGFSYHAPADGRYWFALKHLDAKGQPLGGANVVPQLQLVIDTQLPQLTLSATLDSANQILIRYEAADANLLTSSLLIEARAAGGLWTNVSVGPPESSELGRVAGTVRWPLPQASGEIEIRGSIADGTGQRGQATATVPISGPSFTRPDSSTAPTPLPNVAERRSPFASTARNPFQSATNAVQDWPANNQLPTANPNMTPVTGTPPAQNPYTNASDNHNDRRTPAKFAVDGLENAETNNFAPSLINGNQSTTDAPVALPSTEGSAWASTGRNPGEPLLVNARTFDVEYDLQAVGPWGVAKVELWGTQDNGNTWQSFGIDPDNRSPARVTVPNGGTFGFRILVEGANGVSATPPQAGSEPELTVSVDLQPPTAKLLAAEPGEGNLSDHLRIRWQAADDNLEPRPIGLFYSSFPNGPWSTVAAGLENTGSYVWRIERHVPGRFYLKLEARDTAGNVATFQTPEPLQLTRPQPTGTLRNVRPINGVPTVGGP
ncbi:MAG: hypothetical protein SH868_08580 [Bythopirellula sp.]|nr:hypothetical protein [Bythopirellula sp.]